MSRIKSCRRNLWRIARIGVLALALPLFTGAAFAQTGTLFVEGDKVGIGVPTPSVTLDIQGSAGDTRLRLDESSGTQAARTLFSLANNGGVRFAMQTTQGQSQNSIWQFSALANFLIDFNKNSGAEFLLQQDGDLTIGGTLTQGSSREIKDGFVAVEPRDVLSRVSELPLSTWHYRTDGDATRHLGPMAEDFHAAFGLGTDNRHLAPGDVAGVALAAVQGLNEVIEERDRSLRELEEKVERLEALLAAHGIVEE